MTTVENKILRLIQKYGLLLDEHSPKMYGDKRYGWEKQSDRFRGHVLGVENKTYSEKDVVFAEKIYFDADEAHCIRCYAWTNIPIGQFEEKIAKLKDQYNQAMLEYKNYLMKKKLDSIKRDFE